jgi:cell wall-associated NlpC family hydrolase
MNAAALLVRTDDLIGKPWRKGARGPDAFDCWGLVLVLAERCGRTVPADWRSGDMSRAELRAVMDEAARQRTQRLDGPAEGAIACSVSACHVGYVLHGRVIHAARGQGVTASGFMLWRSMFPDTGWHAWRA